MSHPIHTVGHSTLEPEAFVALLRGAGVTALADVRSSPYSRRLPHFGREAIRPLLEAAGVRYVYLGGHLGGRPGTVDLYAPEGHADYEAMRESPPFREGIERVLKGSERYVVALMCGEEEPLTCHRGLMITPALKALGVPPLHIRKAGRIETTAEFEARVLEEAGFGPMFGECLEEAYRVLNRKLAFRLGEDR